MAGFITNEWAARLLEATVGRTAITTTTAYLGLATAVPEDPLEATLATITEVPTSIGYARKSIPAFNAASVTPPLRITTPTAFSFTAFTLDQPIPATYAFLTDVASGTAGLLRYLYLLPIPVQGVAGEPLNIPASTLVIE